MDTDKLTSGYKAIREYGRCLNCGKKIIYGARSNKKFCNSDCKNNYHNHNRLTQDRLRTYLINKLNMNYRILSQVLESGSNFIFLSDAEFLGFNPCVVSLQHKNGKIQEFACYDIYFKLSAARIYNIHRKSITTY